MVPSPNQAKTPARAPAPLPAEVWRVAKDATEFLNGVRAQLARVEERIIEALAAAPGKRILDVGCGTGHDTFLLSTMVAPEGRAVGVDTSIELIEQAITKAKDQNGPPVEFQVADATKLPFPDSSFDVAMAKRVIEHVADPAAAVRELLRVTAPGGTVVVADPDHGMWAPDMADADFTRRLMAWWCDHIPNPWIGRRLPGLFSAAGVRDVRVDLAPLVLTTLDSADSLTWIRKAAGVAKSTGVFPAEAVDSWNAELERRDADGVFLMYGAIAVVIATAPGTPATG